MNAAETFQQLGFTSSETKLYLASLEQGPSTAIQIARKLHLTRQMVYSLLPNLEERGLIKQIRTGKKRLYQAVDPDILSDLTSQLSDQVKEIVPELKTKAATAKAVPVVTVFDNPLAIREWYRQIMKEAQSGDELLIWATNTAWYQMDPAFFNKYLQFKIKHQVRDRVIAPDTPAARKFEKQISSPFATYSYISPAWTTPAEKVIWKNQIAHFSINENATNMILLESAELVALERAAFEQIWNQKAVSLEPD